MSTLGANRSLPVVVPGLELYYITAVMQIIFTNRGRPQRPYYKETQRKEVQM